MRRLFVGNDGCPSARVTRLKIRVRINASAVAATAKESVEFLVIGRLTQKLVMQVLVLKSVNGIGQELFPPGKTAAIALLDHHHVEDDAEVLGADLAVLAAQVKVTLQRAQFYVSKRTQRFDWGLLSI